MDFNPVGKQICKESFERIRQPKFKWNVINSIDGGFRKVLSANDNFCLKLSLLKILTKYDIESGLNETVEELGYVCIEIKSTNINFFWIYK